MGRKSKRELERELDELTAAGQQKEGLRQNIPTDLVEEWAEFSGHNMEWLEDLT